MSTIHERIKTLRVARGYTQADLARLVSEAAHLDKPILRQAVTQWEDGSTAPARDRVPVLANILGVSVAELLAGNSVTENMDTDSLHAAVPVPIKGMLRGLNAGAVGIGPVRDTEFLEYPTADASAYALVVHGNRLEPRFRAGDWLVVEPDRKPKPGDDVLVKTKAGAMYLRMQVLNNGGTIHLHLINEEHGPMTLALSDVSYIHLVSGHLRNRAER